MGIRYIRKSILRIGQKEMAEITRTTQTSVSRWENGEAEPDRAQMALIRAQAERQGIEWDDRWFFDPDPPEAEAAA